MQAWKQAQAQELETVAVQVLALALEPVRGRQRALSRPLEREEPQVTEQRLERAQRRQPGLKREQATRTLALKPLESWRRRLAFDPSSDSDAWRVEMPLTAEERGSDGG